MLLFGLTATIITSSAYGQTKAGSWNVCFVPAIGINVTLPVTAEMKKYIDVPVETGIVNPIRHYFGLGLQGQYLDDWQLTLKFATTGFSGGFKYGTDGTGDLHSRLTAGNDLGVLDMTIEKRLLKTSLLLSRADLNFLWGIHYVWVPVSQRVDTPVVINEAAISGNIEVSGYYYAYRYTAGALNAGLNLQLYVKHHRSLKVGAMYSYMPGDFMEYRWNTTYNKRLAEQVSINVSKHQLLFYMEYPLKLYGNSASKRHDGRR